MREMPAATAEEEKSKKFKGFDKPAGFIWSVADLLRGDYKQADCGEVILSRTRYSDASTAWSIARRRSCSGT